MSTNIYWDFQICISVPLILIFNSKVRFLRNLIQSLENNEETTEAWPRQSNVARVIIK